MNVTKVKSKDHKKSNKPIYKKWWFWVIIVLFLVGFSSAFTDKDKTETKDTSKNAGSAQKVEEPTSEPVRDYTGQDAQIAYLSLKSLGFSVKFAFDRANNGGFTDEDFQDFVINDSFGSSSYKDMPFVVMRQDVNDKSVTLYIDYGEVVASNNRQANREANLEKRLSKTSAMTACDVYGQRNYKNFKLHGVTGRVAEFASDDNTWYMKYYVDYDGYKDRSMECYVTGTTSSPTVVKFRVY